MKSRCLAKVQAAVAMIAIMGTATICPPPARAGVPGVFATEYTRLAHSALVHHEPGRPGEDSV